MSVPPLAVTDPAQASQVADELARWTEAGIRCHKAIENLQGYFPYVIPLSPSPKIAREPLSPLAEMLRDVSIRVEESAAAIERLLRSLSEGESEQIVSPSDRVTCVVSNPCGDDDHSWDHAFGEFATCENCGIFGHRCNAENEEEYHDVIILEEDETGEGSSLSMCRNCHLMVMDCWKCRGKGTLIEGVCDACNGFGIS